MRRLPVLVGILALLVVPATPAHAAVVAVEVAGGLEFPAAFTFTPDGRIFYGERFSGEIRRYNPATGADTLAFRLPNVVSNGEQGLLGLALHPRFPDQPYVYAYYTESGPKNIIARVGVAAGQKPTFTRMLTLPAASNHNGGTIHFGKDGMLFAVVGDVGNPANAQNLASPAGKVLRMTPSGTVPKNNPFPGSRVYSFGHRNMFGFAFDPLTGKLWVTGNGPACTDEINLVVRAGNYAWGPNQTCTGLHPQSTNQDGPEPRILPEVFYESPMIAPTGAAFCQACGLPGHEGNLVFGAWNDGILRSLTLDAERDDVVGPSVTLLDHTSGVLAVERGTDGAVYFSDPDQIFRLVST